jgi:hypothetical protein
MNHSANSASSPVLSGPLDDPLKSWPNSDLLIKEEDRVFFKRHYAEFAPIFDWPELRDLFGPYDEAATSARVHSRRLGVLAILFGAGGLCLAALIPLAAELTKASAITPLQLQAALGVGSAILASLSIVIGYTQTLRGKEKIRWIMNRFWTERIRQFHFQLIVNNVPAVIAAARDNNRLREWLDIRAQELDRFKHHYLRDVEDKIHHLESDEAEDSPWLFREWERPGPAPPASVELDKLLGLLEQQRLGIQQRYAERKLRSGWHSPDTRAQWVRRLSDILTLILLVATTVGGIGAYAALKLRADPSYVLITGFVAAISSSSIVAMRALKEGLLLSADTERYRWYLATVRSLNRRYEQADREVKVHLLRELEHIAYQEMRRFIVSAAHARFVM